MPNKNNSCLRFVIQIWFICEICASVKSVFVYHTFGTPQQQKKPQVRVSVYFSIVTPQVSLSTRFQRINHEIYLYLRCFGSQHINILDLAGNFQNTKQSKMAISICFKSSAYAHYLYSTDSSFVVVILPKLCMYLHMCSRVFVWESWYQISSPEYRKFNNVVWWSTWFLKFYRKHYWPVASVSSFYNWLYLTWPWTQWQKLTVPMYVEEFLTNIYTPMTLLAMRYIDGSRF